MLQAIIFDLDGVLVDTEPQYYESARRMVAEYGGTLSMADFSRYSGTSPKILWTGLKEQFQITEPLEPLVRRFVAARNRIVAEEGLIRFPHMKDALEGLKKAGYALAVASGSPVLEETLCQLGVEHLFSAWANTMECENAKPWPDVFLLAAHRLGVQPQNCLVIEDGVNGMLGAYRAGMACAGFAGSSFPTDMSPVSCSFSTYQGLTPADFEGFYEAGPVFNGEGCTCV